MVTARHWSRLNRLIMQFVIRRNGEVDGGEGERRGDGGMGLVHLTAILILGASSSTTQLV